MGRIKVLYFFCFNNPFQPGVVVHTYNPSTQEAESGGWMLVQGPAWDIEQGLVFEKNVISISMLVACQVAIIYHLPSIPVIQSGNLELRSIMLYTQKERG